jgi:hypothetical protein
VSTEVGRRELVSERIQASPRGRVAANESSGLDEVIVKSSGQLERKEPRGGRVDGSDVERRLLGPEGFPVGSVSLGVEKSSFKVRTHLTSAIFAPLATLVCFCCSSFLGGPLQVTERLVHVLQPSTVSSIQAIRLRLHSAQERGAIL